MFFKITVAFGFLFLWTNAPLAIAYLWRRFHPKPGAALHLGFEGPVICTLLLLLADAHGPTQWFIFVLPWAFHWGTWIVILGGFRRIREAMLNR